MTHVQILTGLTRGPDTTPRPGAKHILVLNLMPNRAVTEQQFAAAFARCDENVALTFILPATHQVRHNAAALHAAYPTFADVQRQTFDGLIVTGAPLDRQDFSTVDYWDELQTILAWRRTHVRASLFLCWGALAAGHIDGVFEGRRLTDKLVGVYPVGDWHIPQSRYFKIDHGAVHGACVLAGDQTCGECLIVEPISHSTYCTGHFEYLPGTLAAEYARDRSRSNTAAAKPAHYFDANLRVTSDWTADAQRFYTDWLGTIR